MLLDERRPHQHTAQRGAVRGQERSSWRSPPLSAPRNSRWRSRSRSHKAGGPRRLREGFGRDAERGQFIQWQSQPTQACRVRQ